MGNILLFLLGYPLSIISNLSTEYLLNKKLNISRLEKILKTALKKAAKIYNYENSQTRNEINWLVDSMTNRFDVFINTVSNRQFDYDTISNIRNKNYLYSLIDDLIRAYNVHINYRDIFKEVLLSSFDIYEKKIYTTFFKNGDSVLIYNQLLKVNDYKLRKEDIINLQFEIKELNENLSSRSEIEIAELFTQEINKLQYSEVSNSITKEYKRIGRIVEQLTKEQMDILNRQRYVQRMLILGCAGSGKTVLASEKAIRLANAGFKTLILCRSSLLSKHINRLVSNSEVYVYTILGILQAILGKSIINTNINNENNNQLFNYLGYLDLAIDLILENEIYYDAIIVDEGQDFSEEWWVLIEALLEKSESKILYIFADDNQNLFKNDKLYPVKENILSLSKNIRNSGQIFKIIQQIHPSPPPVNKNLLKYGDVRLYKSSDLIKGIYSALKALTEKGNSIANITILSNNENFISYYLSYNIEIFHQAILSAIRKHITEIYNHFGLEQRSIPLDSNPRSTNNKLIIKNLLNYFNSESFKDFFPEKLENNHNWYSYTVHDFSSVFDLSWSTMEMKYCSRPIRLLFYYLKTTWQELLPIYENVTKPNIKNVYSFKGLESEHVILVDTDLDYMELYVGASRGIFSLFIVSSSKKSINWESYGKLEFIKSSYENFHKLNQ
jgi:hypothetical protein